MNAKAKTKDLGFTNVVNFDNHGIQFLSQQITKHLIDNAENVWTGFSIKGGWMVDEGSFKCTSVNIKGQTAQ